MAYLSQKQTATHSSVLTWIGGVWADYREAVRRRAIYRQTFSELNALSNRELADLGLHRSMLRRIAWTAAQEN